MQDHVCFFENLVLLWSFQCKHGVTCTPAGISPACIVQGKLNVGRMNILYISTLISKTCITAKYEWWEWLSYEILWVLLWLSMPCGHTYLWYSLNTKYIFFGRNWQRHPFATYVTLYSIQLTSFACVRFDPHARQEIRQALITKIVTVIRQITCQSTSSALLHRISHERWRDSIIEHQQSKPTYRNHSFFP